jgi:hypothetical protein
LETELAKLSPTKRNKKVGEDKIIKRINQFLIYESFFDEVIQIKQWITSWGDFDHNPIMLEVAPSLEKPTNSFKLNPECLKVEEFVGKYIWKPYNGNLREYSSVQFNKILKEVKNIATKCARDKNMRDNMVLTGLEEALDLEKTRSKDSRRQKETCNTRKRKRVKAHH